MSTKLNDNASTTKMNQPKKSHREQVADLKARAASNYPFALSLAAVLLLAAAAYFSLAYNWPKFSRAEVFFAECVREMFQADNTVTPLYHGTPFFDKPILAYWFIALSYKLFGISHFAARIPSVMLALATAGITAFAGKRLFGERQGVMAAAVLASSLMFISFANLCMSDMPLVFFDTVSLSLLYASVLPQGRASSVALYLASLSMGLAFLTKGPVGIVLPAVSFAAFLTFSKQWKKIEILKHVIPCTLILLGAGVPWFMAAFRQNGPGALIYFFIHENVQRFAGSTYDTHRPLWFMIQSLFSGMLPWSVFLPFALVEPVKRIFNMNKGASTASSAAPDSTAPPETAASSSGTDRNKQLFLCLWIAVVIGFFSASRGKIDYYALPAYPAAALLIGNYLIAACDRKTRVAQVFAWLTSGLMVMAGLASFFVLPGICLHEGIEMWQVLPAILLGSGIAMLRFAGKGELLKTFNRLFAAVCLLALVVSFQVYPWISSKQAVLKYIPYIKALPQDGRVGVYTSLQNWIDEITYQTNTEPMKIEKIKMAEQFLKSSCPSLLLIQQNEYEQMSADSRRNSQVIGSSPFIPRSLNPVYVMKQGQKLAAQNRLLLVSNEKKAVRGIAPLNTSAQGQGSQAQGQGRSQIKIINKDQ